MPEDIGSSAERPKARKAERTYEMGDQLTFVNPDGTREIVTDPDISAEIAWQSLGNPPRGDVTYKLQMLGHDGRPTEIKNVETPQSAVNNETDSDPPEKKVPLSEADRATLQQGLETLLNDRIASGHIAEFDPLVEQARRSIDTIGHSEEIERSVIENAIRDIQNLGSVDEADIKEVQSAQPPATPPEAAVPAGSVEVGPKDDLFENVTRENLQEKLDRIRAEEAAGYAEIQRLRDTLTPAQHAEMIQRVQDKDRESRARLSAALQAPRQQPAPDPSVQQATTRILSGIAGFGINRQPRPEPGPSAAQQPGRQERPHVPLAQPRPQERTPRYGERVRSVIREPSSAPSMGEINRDPKKLESFKSFLEANGQSELLEKNRRSIEDPSAMSAADEEELEDARHEFQRRSLLATEMRAGIRSDDIYQMLEDPSLKFILNNVSAERGDALIRQNIERVFMRSNGGEVDAMIFAQRNIHIIRAGKQYQGVDERLKRMLGERATVENTNWGALRPNDRMQALRPSMYSLFNFSESKIRSIKTLNELAAHRQAIMDMLGASVSSDRELRKRIIAEAYPAERPAAAAAAAPAAEARAATPEAAAEAEVTDLKKLRESVPGFKNSYQRKFGHSWESDTPEARESNFFNSISDQEQRTNKPHGWFGALLAAIFSSFVARAKHDPQLKEAFA